MKGILIVISSILWSTLITYLVDGVYFSTLLCCLGGFLMGLLFFHNEVEENVKSDTDDNI